MATVGVAHAQPIFGGHKAQVDWLGLGLAATRRSSTFIK